jgi:hypothetical protein
MNSHISGNFNVSEGAFINIKVSNFGNNKSPETFPFQIDTGSFITVININVYNKLKLRYIRDAKGVKLGGDKEAKDWFYSFLVLEIPPLSIKEEIEVLVNPNSKGTNLLGRDIIIKVFSVFDGQNNTYTITK